MSTDSKAKYAEHPTTRADFARRTGRSRSTITEACAGPLAPACRDGRIDAAHPACVEWARKRGIDPERLLEHWAQDELQAKRDAVARAREPSQTLTFDEVAKLTGRPVEEARAKFGSGPAFIPRSHVPAEQFAFFASCSADDVFEAIDDGSLAPAVSGAGYLDLEHPAALKFMARRPVRTGRDSALKLPAGYLSSAMIGKEVDVNHPVARVFLARCLGRVPTKEDIEGTA